MHGDYTPEDARRLLVETFAPFSPRMARMMDRAFEEFRPDTVFHLAAESHVDRSIDGPGEFVRTANRHDYSLAPPQDTVIDALAGAGLATISIGKIADIFNHRHISEENHSESSVHGMEQTIEYADLLAYYEGLIRLRKKLPGLCDKSVDAVKRICFMLLSCCTYAYILFSLMMEQYLVSCFWLILCVYVTAERGRAERLPFWGAGGSLLTSAILLPAMSEKSPFRDFKGWFMDMLKYGLEFAALFLAFCRMDVVFELYSRLVYFGSFTGKAITMGDKLRQYTDFVCNIFSAPDAGPCMAFGHISWQLNEQTGIRIAGIAILVLVLVSAVWNREKRSSRLAIFWVGFSVVMLLGLGWGTQENGLILYSLYFGWAFLVLLWQLAEKIGETLKLRWFVPALSLAAAAALLLINVPAVMAMLDFAVTHYPVV